LGALLLGACSGALQWNGPQAGGGSEPAPASYTVKTGDTLYSISWRYGLDYHDVAAWNRLSAGYLIHPGDRLALAAPPGALHAATPSVVRIDKNAPPPTGNLQWVWPASGQVVRLFHAGSALAKGVDISAPRGSDVLAAAAGKVVYAGSGIIGYGKLVIIKNSEDFLSAYADNDDILVKEGDAVRTGQRIAVMGLGRDNLPVLHFEIRYNGTPVDPLSYLPRR
jgi:lipoprotein NlpD